MNLFLCDSTANCQCIIMGAVSLFFLTQPMVEGIYIVWIN